MGNMDFRLPVQVTAIPRVARDWGISEPEEHAEAIGACCADLLAVCLQEAFRDALAGSNKPLEELALNYFKLNIRRAMLSRGIPNAVGVPLTPYSLDTALRSIRVVICGRMMGPLKLTEMSPVSALRERGWQEASVI